jgi:hypothetical protein
MAVTENQAVKRQGRDGNIVSVPVAANKVLYEGTLCYLDAGGDASDVINTDVGRFVGIVRTKADNTGGADAAINVDVWTDGTFELTLSSATLVLGDVGKTVYGVDNSTISETGADQPEVGVVRKYISTTKALVEIRGLGLGPVVAAT